MSAWSGLFSKGSKAAISEAAAQRFLMNVFIAFLPLAILGLLFGKHGGLGRIRDPSAFPHPPEVVRLATFTTYIWLSFKEKDFNGSNSFTPHWFEAPA